MFKQRIISAAVGILAFGILLCFVNTVLFPLVVGLVCAQISCELCSVILDKKFKLIKFSNVFISVCIPLFILVGSTYYLEYLLCLLIIIAILCSMQYRKELKMERIFFAFIVSFSMSASLSTFVLIRSYFSPNYNLCLLAILLVASSAWMTDTGGYFIGNAWGKHKLNCSDISPHKTKEGVAGGIAVSLCSGLVICFIFKLITPELKFDGLLLTIVLLVASVLAVLGDLFASLIKRQYEIKDFGKIMPGHGGLLDRLDSLIFVIPFYYFIFCNFKVFWL
ncbi:MAG: phosphatidate cytidylyltransferase [Oscillospiraceae bacterium]